MFQKFLLTTLFLCISFCYADNLQNESNVMSAEQYRQLSQDYANKAAYYCNLANQAESNLQANNESSINCSGSTTAKQVEKNQVYNPWLGTQFGFGAGSASGDNENNSINASAIVNYKSESSGYGWQSNTIGQYDYLNSYGSGSNKNRLYLQQNVAYMYDSFNGMFTQASYLNDANDGYYYVWNENIGYKLQLINSSLMGLQFSVGPGLQQVQTIKDNLSGTKFQWLTQMTYNLNLNNILTFYEQLQNTATQANTTTYSISTLNLQIDKNFGIGINYQLTYNSNPPAGKSALNAISSINLVYGVN